MQVVSNPEFLKEGTAVQDCLNPDRIVIGGESPEAFRMMRRLYDPLVKREENFMTMNWESAELTKYAANSHARRPHLVHERDDDPLRALRRRHRGHPQGHRLRLAASARRSSGPAAATAARASPRTSPRWSTSPRPSGHESLFVNAIQTINKNQKKRFVDKIDAEARPPDRRRDDRGLGPGVQGRHRRHPRVGRDRRDPLPAGQGRARPAPRLQGAWRT